MDRNDWTRANVLVVYAAQELHISTDAAYEMAYTIYRRTR